MNDNKKSSKDININNDNNDITKKKNNPMPEIANNKNNSTANHKIEKMANNEIKSRTENETGNITDNRTGIRTKNKEVNKAQNRIDKAFENRIDKAFENGKALIGFLTAGDPSLSKTKEFILTMVKAGVDLIEIGVPFSDPIAEGEVIQRANDRALKAGTTTDGLFGMVRQVREETDIPLALLTYMNPVFVYGIHRFFEQCGRLGINGIIIPDLPYEEKKEVLEIAEQNHIDLITMIAPTSKNRIKMLASDAKGFVYVVSSMGVTGVRNDIQTDLKSIIEEIRKVTDTKTAVGFGISTPQQARDIAKIADGVIIGSAIVKIIEESGGSAGPKLFGYIREMKKGLKI